MSRARRIARAQAAGKEPAAAAAQSAAAPSPRLATLLLAGLATLAFFLWARLLVAREPWSYDEYYHLGVAREWLRSFPLRAFPWTPESLWSAHFADKEVLFHLLLVPFSRLPLEWAGTLGTALGQIFLIATFAWGMLRLRVPGAGWFVLGWMTLGPMLAYRLGMCRPHLLLLGFAVLLLVLLASRAPLWALGLASALFGLAHAGGWVGIPFALLFALAGWWQPRGVSGDREFAWRPLLAVALGWVAGQCVHPNLPYNWWMLWVQNVTVVKQSAPGGEVWLQAMLGGELTPPEARVLLQQWPAFLPAALAVALLVGRPLLRNRTTLTFAVAAVSFLAVGALLLRRMFELGAPLGLLALAAVVAERERRAPGAFRRAPRWVLGAWLLVGGAWTTWMLLHTVAARSAPRPMAEWVAQHATAGEKIFTAQWADSAPLFYFAPQARTLVALDPTFFWLKDRARFDDYARIAFGRDADPARSIRERFGADLVTIQKVPDFQALAVALSKSGAERVYEDEVYQIWRLPAPPQT